MVGLGEEGSYFIERGQGSQDFNVYHVRPEGNQGGSMQRAELRGLQADKGKCKTQRGNVFVRVQRTARRPIWIERSMQGWECELMRAGGDRAGQAIVSPLDFTLSAMRDHWSIWN